MDVVDGDRDPQADANEDQTVEPVARRKASERSHTPDGTPEGFAAPHPSGRTPLLPPDDAQGLEGSAIGTGTRAACPDLRHKDTLTPTIQTIKPT